MRRTERLSTAEAAHLHGQHRALIGFISLSFLPIQKLSPPQSLPVLPHFRLNRHADWHVLEANASHHISKLTLRRGGIGPGRMRSGRPEHHLPHKHPVPWVTHLKFIFNFEKRYSRIPSVTGVTCLVCSQHRTLTYTCLSVCRSACLSVCLCGQWGRRLRFKTFSTVHDRCVF